jgi:hypothetical protein
MELELEDLNNEELREVIKQCIDQIIRNTENETAQTIYEDDKFNEGAV